MLHEVLLSLSGHSSPLFSDDVLSAKNSNAEILSPSERALLRTIGELADLHRRLRHDVREIASQHASTICRAVATSIQQSHLPRFQDKIIEVEKKILKEDPSLVGAYNIVPLAGVVAEFDEWHRRMAWYWSVTSFMKPDPSANDRPNCTSATLINKLRTEQHTGFPDIEKVAIELSQVAETAWLRQVASWMLYGQLPKFGADDFFVQRHAGEQDQEPIFVKEKSLLPDFVASETASSILFIGKSLHQVQKYDKHRNQGTSLRPAGSKLAVTHAQHLTALSLPVVSAQLSRAVSAIRLSLSQNVLQHLLPVDLTLILLSCLQSFFLLGRGEFAITLIQETESRLDARQQSMGKFLQKDPVKALQSLSIKEAEFGQTLSATWKALLALEDDAEDETLEFAQKHVSLSASSKTDSRPSTADSTNGASVDITSVAFNDLLFPSPTTLGLSITPPLDLFISQKEIETYSTINAYLLSIRRAHLRLSDLWRRTLARRDDASATANGEVTSTEVKARIAQRRIATRKIWATCSAAIFLVSETSAYFEGEIIELSWKRFEEWVKTPVSHAQVEMSTMTASTASAAEEVQRDPETLASGHRTFLHALLYGLLLHDLPYTRELRSLLGNVDNFIALFDRLLEVQQKSDLEHDTGTLSNYTAEEEQRMTLELDRTRKRVDSDLKSVVNRLRQLDHDRVGAAAVRTPSSFDVDFKPYKPGGVDRLLMKLDFGRMAETGFDIV